MAKKEKIDLQELENQRRKQIFEIISTVELDPGYLLVDAKPRNPEQHLENGMLPPSDFFVVHKGDTDCETGQEILLKPSSRMALVKDIHNFYLVERTEIAAKFSLTE